MPPLWVFIASVFIAYLIGSLPFGLLVGKWIAGVDIRKSGSGNIGATNIARQLGPKYGAFVLILDCLKGVAATTLVPMLFAETAAAYRLHLAVLCGISAIIGHMFPCWLRFRGGKGVATALGVALVLGPWACAAATVAFFVCFAATRIVSISSIVAACTFCILELTLLRPVPFGHETWSVAPFSIAAPTLIIFRHRTNIVRLWRGEEPRFQFGGKNRPTSPTT